MVCVWCVGLGGERSKRGKKKRMGWGKRERRKGGTTVPV